MKCLDTNHSDTKAHPGVGALYELLGDDMDGAAAMFDDYSSEFEDWA